MNRYQDTMNRLRFTAEQKDHMVDRLMASEQSAPRRALPIRRLAAVGVAAALVVSLSAAGAAGMLGSAGDAFASLFGANAAQTEIIDQIGYPVGACATSGGVTITADAILGDTYSYAIVYSIQREDGQPLVSEDVLAAAAEQDMPLPLRFNNYGTQLHIPGNSHGQSFFYDADPADSAIQFVEMHTSDRPLKAGVATVKFQDLSLYANGDYRDPQLLAEGTWKLKFDFAFEDCSISLPAGQAFQLNGMDAILDSVTLSPLSIQVNYTVFSQIHWDENRENGQQSEHDREQSRLYFDSLPIIITYADGTTLDLTNAGGSLTPGDGKTVCQKSRIFDTIQALNEMVSVTVGDVVIPVSR